MKSPCKYPGCPALVDKSGYCEAHAQHANAPRKAYDEWRKRDPKQSAIDSFRRGSQWRRVAKLKLSADPMCADPFEDHKRRGCTETAKQVHHIKPLATHPELGLHWDNLMSVCTKCHAKLERQPPP